MARSILYGALAVGALDLADAMVFWGIHRRVPPIRIAQSVAAGLLGRAAMQGGAATAALGVGLHFAIASAVVATYCLASRRLPVLARRPWLCGSLYGLAVFGVMTFVVVPLSATRNPPLTAPVLWNGLLGHALLIGVPSALAARRAARKPIA